MRRTKLDKQLRFREALGHLLRNRRQEMMLSQEELGEAAAVSQASISNYETGRSEVPLSVLLCLCSELQISPADLIAHLDI